VPAFHHAEIIKAAGIRLQWALQESSLRQICVSIAASKKTGRYG
jgi:hypothetical protein